MTAPRITLQDGKLVLRDGKVGTEQECCCGGGEECVCPAGCVEGLQVSLGNAPTCYDGFYSDSIPCASGAISASMYCDNGKWLVFVSVCCSENDGLCFVAYEAELQCEEDNLPPAGAVNLIQTAFFEQDNGCPPLPPTVNIIK